MHLKNWFLGLCLIVLLAGEFFLFSANRQKEAALEQARAAKQDAAQARAELEQIKIADAAEFSTLKAQNQDLPRLRGQVTQLQSANKKLSQQLNTTLTAAQQQQEQLQQIAAENQARAAEQAQTQAESERDTCINNLRQIDAAKNQWALDNNKTAGAIPTEQDLLPYIKDQVFPVCPSGGTYTIGTFGVDPTCSVPGHAIP
jgi:hypothetical protein